MASRIMFKHELSTGERVWVQQTGRYYMAIKCPDWGEPEFVGPMRKQAALDILIQWLQEDICEV